MKQDTAISYNPIVSDAVNEISRKLSPTNKYIALIFFASVNYDFQVLSTMLKERYPDCEVIGCSTSGEILNGEGFVQHSIVATALSCDKTWVSGVLISNVEKFNIFGVKTVEDAARKIGINPGTPDCHNDAFALCFVNGLCNAEETLTALFYAIIKNENFILAGGSAGDDLQFKKTYVSYNGTVATEGAVLLFVRTRCKFDIRKKNLFTPIGKLMKITDAAPHTRKIISIDGEVPQKRYAQVLGISEKEVNNAQLVYPFGRRLYGDMYISSIAGFNDDGTMNMYCKVTPGSFVELLKEGEISTIAEETCKSISENIPRPGAVILVNCILRTIYFNQKSLVKEVLGRFDRYFPKFCGFSSYGEQFGRFNCNQTLVSIVIGE
ncbi:MAG: FIST C-terminal domain-containing protein [Treponema sp.]|nr:FIST C-terminal domain-containing protein [Treponema sp.]